MKPVTTCTYLALLILLSPWLANAAPNLLTYQGRILKSDSTPLEYNNVSFQFEVTSPDGLCVLYREQVNGINMTNSGGVFDVSIGSGTKSFPTDPTFKLLDSFANAGAVACYGGASYSPAFDDVRKLRVQFNDGTGWKVISPDSEIRSVPFAGQSVNSAKLGNYTAAEFVLKTGLPVCSAGTFLSWDGTNLTCSGVAGASGGTVTNVTSNNAYLTVVNGTSTPALTLNVGTAANTVAAGDDSRLSDARIPTGTAGGDLSSTYPNPKVAKIQGVAISTTAPTSGDFFKYNGAQWIPSGITTSDVAGLAASLSGYVTQSYFNTAVASANCSVSQTMYWNSATNNFLCQSINVGVAGDVSGSLGAVSVDKIKGVAIDFSTAPTNGQILKYNGTSWVPAADNNAGGTITSLTGDVTASGTGAVAATVASVGTSTAANVHTAELLANAATNLNTASAIVKRDGSGNFAAGAVSAGTLVLRDTGSNTVTWSAPGTVSTSYVLKLPTAQGGSNQLMINDGSGNLSWTNLSSLGVASVGVTSPITNSGSASAPVIGIQVANGTQAGYLASADWTTFNNKLSTSLTTGQIWIGAANVATPVTPAGDVTISTAGATLVGKIQGTGVVSTSPTATNNFFKYNGTNWAPGYIGVADIRSTAAGNAQFLPTTCTAAQTLNWQSATDTYICATIAISDSQITYASKTAKTFLAAPTAGGVPTFRTIASTDLPTTGVDGAYINGGNSFGAAATIGLNDNYNLSLKTNNTTRMTIDNAGKVAISANAPLAQLHVVGTASAQTDYAIGAFEDASANGLGIGVDIGNGWAWLYGRSAGVSPRPVAIFAHNSNQIPDLLVSGGTVGINTAAPQAPLHVVNTFAGIFSQEGANDTRGGEFNGYKSRGTVTAPTSVLAGDRLMGLYGDGYYGAGFSANAGAIEIAAAENFTNSNRGTAINFGTTPLGSTVRATRMTVDSTGYVGIGTTTPAYQLDILATNTDAAIRGTAYTSTVNSGGTFIGSRARGTFASPTNPLAGDLIAQYLGKNAMNPLTNPGMLVWAGENQSSSALGDYLTFYTTPNGATVSGEKMRILGNGNVGIGTTTPAVGLDVVASTGTPMRLKNSNGGNFWQVGPDVTGNFVIYNSGGTGMYITSGGTAWIANSDRRIKRNIELIPDSLRKLEQINGVTYWYKTDLENEPRRVGVIAQDVQKVLPEAVGEKNGILGVRYQELIPLVINAIKEFYAEFKTESTEQNRKIASLEEENRKLKETVDKQSKTLEQQNKDLAAIKSKLGL